MQTVHRQIMKSNIKNQPRSTHDSLLISLIVAYGYETHRHYGIGTFRKSVSSHIWFSRCSNSYITNAYVKCSHNASSSSRTFTAK